MKDASQTFDPVRYYIGEDGRGFYVVAYDVFTSTVRWSGAIIGTPMQETTAVLGDDGLVRVLSRADLIGAEGRSLLTFFDSRTGYIKKIRELVPENISHSLHQ
jgi:hypothetical protein